MNTATSPSPNAAATTTVPGDIRIVMPPASIKRMSRQPNDGAGHWVDYASHPAYRDMVAEVGFADRLGALKVFARNFSLILVKRLISYELIPAHLRNPTSATGLVRFLKRVGRHLLNKVAPPQARRSGAGDKVLAQLQNEGICVVQVDPAQFARLQALAKPQYEALRQRRGRKTEGHREFDESRASAKRTSEAALFSQVETILETSGALDGVSAYIGRQAALVDVNPQINDTSDDFWRHIFVDLPPADRPARYMHRDASGGDIKAILYMSDVGPQNGPFSYVLGSHKTRSASLGDWIEEANDQGPLSGTGQAARRVFAALPKSLQRKASCGNDILPGTLVAERLLGAEWTITSPRGHLVLFDTKGFHRGGLVDQDERIVMTCVMG